MKLSQASLPHLQRSGGNIVNVSSIAGLRAYPGALAYKMSKAAMDQMTRCVALEVRNCRKSQYFICWSTFLVAGSGVRVNSVNPAVIVTDIFTRSGMTEDETAAYLEHSRLLHPLGRPGRPEEVEDIIFLIKLEASFNAQVASVIGFLASEAASFITGQTLAVDGGRSVALPSVTYN